MHFCIAFSSFLVNAFQLQFNIEITYKLYNIFLIILKIFFSELANNISLLFLCTYIKAKYFSSF